MKNIYQKFQNYTSVQQAIILIGVPIFLIIFASIISIPFRVGTKTGSLETTHINNTATAKYDWRANVENSLQNEIFPKQVSKIKAYSNVIEVHLYDFQLADYNTAIACVREFQGVYFANTGDELVSGLIYHGDELMKRVSYVNKGLIP